ncbi:MAG: metallophosphoesterase family protein [Isosphaeraceae bacterium]
MRLGLLADLHEDVEMLERAIDRLERLGVDRYVMLGDVFDRGDATQLDRVAELLEGVGAIGVWGNHDFGLCCGELDDLALRYSARTLRYMRSLRGRIEIDGCLFSHIEPALDPSLLEDLWGGDLPPNTPERAAASFAAMPHRLMFMGHIHCWIAVRPGEVLPWRAEGPLRLAPPDRYLVVVHAVRDGWCAHFDTTTHLLTPIALIG